MKLRYRANSRDGGLKLQVFLKQRLGESYSVRQVKTLIDRNRCQVNGRIERFGSTAVEEGDRIQLVLGETKQTVQILHKEDGLIILDKPAGLTTEQTACEYGEPAHRLDRDTSGILVISKEWQTAFRERRVEKGYHAIVEGIPSETEGVIENRLGPKRSFHGQTIYGSKADGKWAKTHWEVVQVGSNWSLIHCRPETGRTHQLRVHLAGIGHPVIGDGQYGSTRAAKRHLLHASSLKFGSHHFTSPQPADFVAYTDR